MKEAKTLMNLPVAKSEFGRVVLQTVYAGDVGVKDLIGMVLNDKRLLLRSSFLKKFNCLLLEYITFLAKMKTTN